MFKGKKIYLRPPEKSDVTQLLIWENNPETWHLSDTEAPYSIQEMLNYVKQASAVRANQQVRFMICSLGEKKTLGTIDLFSISFKDKRAGIGILIAERDNREKGYAKEAISLCMEYGLEVLEIDNYFCSVHADNFASIKLFESLSFECIGVRKKWFKKGNTFVDEILFQKLI